MTFSERGPRPLRLLVEPFPDLPLPCLQLGFSSQSRRLATRGPCPLLPMFRPLRLILVLPVRHQPVRLMLPVRLLVVQRRVQGSQSLPFQQGQPLEAKHG